MELNKILNMDCLAGIKSLPDNCINTCITSPPYYGLRDYGVDGQIGAESSPKEYVARLVEVFREVRRVLRPDGTLWVNIGDTYAAQRGGTHPPAETLAGGTGGKMKDGAIVNRGRNSGYNPTRNAAAIGLKHKDLIGIPWMLAFALREDGWYLRQDIIWAKPNPMPESVKDRCTKSHEYIFLLSKSEKYYYDHEAIKEPAVNGGKRSRRDVWTVNTRGYKGAHFAVFPEQLIEPCVLAGCPEGGVVLDPFLGSGTTAVVAAKNHRNFIGIELSAEYAELGSSRVSMAYEAMNQESTGA